MGKFLYINGIIRYVEATIKEDINYDKLEQSIGFSYRYIREEFKKYAKKSLKNYINSRKIAYSALQIETTNKSLTDIAYEYGYHTYDTFSRCFKREVGVTPRQYKKDNYQWIERKLIGLGTYAPAFKKQIEYHDTEHVNNDSHILYGVPKIEFSNGKCTPFPSSLESVLSYIGQRNYCDYTWLMATTGASFRLCWNKQSLDLSNSNISNIYPDDTYIAYKQGIQSAGWTCNIMESQNSSKDDFIVKIKTSIQKGIPVLALGVIGPPEACIITGYKENGDVLAGWSYFQDNPEFMNDNSIDISGYFLTDSWWGKTTAIITLEDRTVNIPPIKDILHTVYDILTKEIAGNYFTGQIAYECWANNIKDDPSFRETDITPLLLNNFFVQSDVETMVCEGRYWGAEFFKQITLETNEVVAECNTIANRLFKISQIVKEMTELRKGSIPSEESITLLCNKDIRNEIYQRIQKAKTIEESIIPLIDDLCCKFK